MSQTNLVPRSKSKYINKILSTFGSSLIGYWPLNEHSGSVALDWSGNNRHGSYTGVDLAQAGIGDRQASPYFDGVNDYVNLYSAGLVSAFNGAEGTLLLWGKVFSWATIAATQYLARLAVDTNNLIYLRRSTTDNRLIFTYTATTSKTVNIDGITTPNFFSMGCTWSKSADKFIGYFAGAQAGTPQTGLGTWSGSLAAASTALGVFSTSPTGNWKGWLAHAALLNRPATAAEMQKAGVL
jgi:hypothetical protein